MASEPTNERHLTTIFWHALVAFALVLLPGWILFFVAGMGAVSFPVVANSWCCWIVHNRRARGTLLSSLLTRYPIALASSVIVATCVAVIFLGVLLLKVSQYSRLLLIISSMLVAGGIFACFAGTGWRIKRLHFFFAGFFLAGTIVLQLAVHENSIPTPNPETRTLNASQHILTATYYRGYVPDDGQVRVSGGAIAPDPTVRGSYLLVTARGTFYRLSWDTSDRLRVQSLGLQVPINSASFEKDVSDDIPKNTFRVADIAIRPNDIGADIFVSHHYWKREEGCVRQFEFQEPRWRRRMLNSREV